MNRTLFTSWYAILGLLICAGFFFWLKSIGAKAGSGPGSDNFFLLTSGWTAFALMVIVVLYSLRKFMHKLGISPETKSPPPIANLERAESRMNELRAQIVKKIVNSKSDVAGIANRILKEEGVAKVVRIEVEAGATGGPAFLIRAYPTEPFGRVAKWLHMHIYLGLASGVLVWLHGGGSNDSILGAAMNWLTWTVLFTGVVGTFLFALGPTWLSRAEKDLTFEESFVLNQVLQGKLDQAYQNLDPESLSLFKSAQGLGADFSEKTARMAEEFSKKDAASKSALQDMLALLGQKHRIADSYRRLSKIKFWMNFWRAIHVPASIVLLGIVIIHIVSVWWY